MAIIIYGIKTCDTMKKARAWLEGRGLQHRFHDYRVDGLDAAILRGWIDQVGWQVLLNKASATFRGLADADKTSIDQAKAETLMLVEPTMIKRPVLDVDGRLVVGFKPAVYEEVFASA
ncbi:ArsC family reductase [Nitratireductor sp. CAU 1489]|uniref:ArsC family reductase n=1 Tax=Nitratireductor arenosus TaxID=2682096 RepID=A0A844QHF1_9HYPH|nr:ArsC family reductase [Nitratireductor arenosus]MVA98725.1 ArsC family reductase [Nitratireductor arenosus]